MNYYVPINGKNLEELDKFLETYDLPKLNYKHRKFQHIPKYRKYRKKGNPSKLILQSHHYPNIKTRQGPTRKESYGSITNEHRCKILNKILAKHIKRLCTMIKWECIPGMQGWFNINLKKKKKVIQYIKRMKSFKNHLTISMNAEKSIQ
jgi:hypothetical protein